MRILRLSSCLCLMLSFFRPVFADEPLKITIDDGIENALAVAIVPFGWSQAGHIAPIDLAAIIGNDLSRSGRFDVMEEQYLPQHPTRYASINFDDWRRLGMETILIGQLELSNAGDYEVSFRLIDIFRAKQIIGFRIPAKENALRRVAHQISDIIFEKLLGMRGAFDTRIAYITVKKNQDNTIYTLEVADSDGFNTQVLLESKEPLLSPAWSPDGKKIAYVSFEGKNSAIYIQEVLTGKRDRIAAFTGINSAPNWSPDGSRLAMTLSKDGNTEIYIMDLQSRSLRRITQHAGIDTEPAWSPDGQKLAFTSDRGGSPQIYAVNVSGGQPKRLSFEGNYNARPDYSPDGKYITLVHAVNGAYRIGLLELDSGYITTLTDARLDESPSFAPNGGMIIYATTGHRGAQLATVSTDARIRQRFGLRGGDVREPAWGPFLK